MLPAAALAVPFLPDSDAEVLERLPWTANDAAETLARVRRAQKSNGALPVLEP